MTACWLCVDGSARNSGGIEYGLNSILTEKWEGKTYRLVIQRQRRVDGNLDLWELKKTSRIKAFVFKFISVPAKWIRTARHYQLNIYTDNKSHQNPFAFTDG